MPPPPQFISPVYRSGTVISAKVEPSTSARSRNATLGASGSRQLGRLIVRHKDAYQKVFADALSKDGIVLEFENSDCKVHLTPGVVIDFPCFAVDWDSGVAGRYRILGRPCLATCINTSQSKIWFRFILNGDLPSARQGDAVTKAYFDFVQQLSDSLISVALDRYNSEFSRFLNTDVEMKRSYTVEFLCGDVVGADNLLGLEPKKVFDKVGIGRPGLKSILVPKAQETVGEARYVEFNVDDGEKGVFVRLFGRKKAILKGLYLYSRRHFENAQRNVKRTDAFYQHSGALGLTAGLANIIGQAF